MRHSRIIPAFFLALFGGVWASQLASCTLDTYGAKPPPAVLIPCSTDDNCDDTNPCTIDKCNTATKICEAPAGPDGTAPNAGQTPYDCQVINCVAGVATSANDPQDLPNDNNTCTEDICTGGIPSNPVTPNDTPCNQGTQTGTCDNSVCIIACDAMNPCNDDNPCTDDFCNVATSRCVFTNVDGLPTPGFKQIIGDCHQQLCLAGIDTPVVDDSDFPDDKNSCTQDLCANGMTSFPGQMAGTPCIVGDVKVCDGVDKCVECTLPIHCLSIVEDECTQRDCVGNKCQPKFAGTDTLASAALQQPGDCKKTVCNGSGGTTVVDDNAEIPDDGIACTTDTCSSGMPMHVAVASGMMCGMNQVCNATAQCVGCIMPTDCAGSDDACKTRICTAGVCGFTYKPDNTQVPMVQVDKDCKVVVCDGAGNIVTKVDINDIPVDGNDCTKDLCAGTGNGTPSNPNESLGTNCAANGGDVCDGNGTCKKSDGLQCSVGTECLNTQCVDTVCCENACGTTCKSCNLVGSAGKCTNVGTGADDSPNCSGANISCDGSGICKKENGQTCSMGVDCLSNNCIDGVCCATNCTETCKSCNVAGSPGSCSFLPNGSQDTIPANTCDGTKQCNGTGSCITVSGTTCTLGTDCSSGFCVDGYCCNSACTATCQACNVAGSLGTCTTVAAGSPDNTCSPSQTCNATAQCVTANGQACTMANQCGSGFCNDGVCCNEVCTGTCKSCNLAGSAGICSNIPSPQQDTNAGTTCTGTSVCNGAGACVKANGQTCAAGTDCGSGFCVDGVCCENACMGTCMACNLTVKGVCANIGFNQDDNNATTTCSGNTISCDGNGVCKKNYGQTCSMLNGSECLSNFCVDGYCCNNSCTSTCKSCSVSGSLGACSNIPLGTTDNNPTNACSGNNVCNGGGMCKRKNGQPCMQDPDCASNHCNNNVCGN